MTLDISNLLGELTETRAFSRIRRVSFLGIIDLINQQRKGVRPAYSRAEHSLGVLRLGYAAAKHIQMDEVEAAHLLAACMVHDMGHPPFSHSLEYAFKKHDRMTTHHDVLREILLAPSGNEREVPRIVKSHGLSAERLYNIIDGGDPLSFFFLSPINIDTLDGINRSMESFGIFPTYNLEILTQITAEIYAGGTISNPAVRGEMDRFWHNKSLFYRVLSSENPLSLAERKFQRAVRRHLPKLSRGHFRLTDQEFSLRYPQVMLESNLDMGPEEIAARQDFLIDSTVGSVDRKTVYDRYVRVKYENRRSKLNAS